MAGQTTERGYGWPHQRRRARVEAKVKRGTECCARCGELIELGPDGKPEPWDLDHDDHDRSEYLGPSHARCNRGRLRIASPVGPISPNSEAW